MARFQLFLKRQADGFIKLADDLKLQLFPGLAATSGGLKSPNPTLAANPSVANPRDDDRVDVGGDPMSGIRRLNRWPHDRSTRPPG